MEIGFCKNFFLLLEPKLLVMWERNDEALQIVCEVLYIVYANSTGARECVAQHGMALEPFSTNW